MPENTNSTTAKRERKIVRPSTTAITLAPSTPVTGLPNRFVDVGSIYPVTSPPDPIKSSPAARANIAQRHRIIRRVKRVIYLVCIVLAIASFFLRDSYQLVRNINPASYPAPQQTPTEAQTTFINHRGVNYQVTPVYDYVLTGLLVSRRDYEKLPEAKQYADDTLLPIDVCVIWGDNLRSGVYKNFSTRFSQYDRFCSFSTNNENASPTDISNSHLVFADPAIKAKMKGIKAGDQIKITGKLVNVASPPGTPSNLQVNRYSSTIRTDTGNGACEDILVDDVAVIQPGNDIFQTLFPVSLMIIGLLAGGGYMSRRIRDAFNSKNKNTH
jgi:hypothetical protein